MARPQKRTVDYFPHYATSGKTLLILQNEFGNDGYAFWFKLLSLLCRTDGQVYDYNIVASWKLLLAETQVSEDIANSVLQILADIDAIDKELHSHKVIWVQNLVDNLEDVYSRRTNGSKPTKPIIVDNNVAYDIVNVSDNPINDNSKPQTKLNKTKLNKTKEDTKINSSLDNQGLISGQSVEKAIKIAQGKLEASPRNKKACQEELTRRGIKWQEGKGVKSDTR